MPSEFELDMLARIIAQERTVIWLARVALATASQAQKEEFRKHAVESMRPDTYPGLDPALSDHLAAEVTEAVANLWREIVEPPNGRRAIA